jgi:ATP-dependent Lhr-like helicase
VSGLREQVDRLLDSHSANPLPREHPAIDWLAREAGILEDAAEQTITYLAEGRKALGLLPTQDTLVLERFFDESGGMQLVLHAPFGSRINKAWALALRKRFCRQFNFELQAAATEDALLLSLGPMHSFPLSDVFGYLHPETVRDVLIQAFLDAPVFETRWRWNATISLAVPRNRGSRKVAPPVQRMLAADLLASVFPDAAACLENIPGDREIPDHPLVSQTVRDCLEDAMDLDGLRAVLRRIHAGELRLVSRDTPEPSALAHGILNAAPYAFLDDAPLEERRSHAVQTRRGTADRDDLGALDVDAIARVRDECRPDPRDADELHDVLMTVGLLRADECPAAFDPWLDALAASGRAALVDDTWWTATERLPEVEAVHPGRAVRPPVEVPQGRRRGWPRSDAVRELLRGRFTIGGPVTAGDLTRALRIDAVAVEDALLALESEGAILRGTFSPPQTTDAPRAERPAFAPEALRRVRRSLGGDGKPAPHINDREEAATSAAFRLKPEAT